MKGTNVPSAWELRARHNREVSSQQVNLVYFLSSVPPNINHWLQSVPSVLEVDKDARPQTVIRYNIKISFFRNCRPCASANNTHLRTGSGRKKKVMAIQCRIKKRGKATISLLLFINTIKLQHYRSWSARIRYRALVPVAEYNGVAAPRGVHKLSVPPLFWNR